MKSREMTEPEPASEGQQCAPLSSHRPQVSTLDSITSQGSRHTTGVSIQLPQGVQADRGGPQPREPPGPSGAPVQLWTSQAWLSEPWRKAKAIRLWGCVGGSAVESLPSAQGVILETRDRAPHRAPCVEPASPSACFSLCLCCSIFSVSFMNK